MQNHRRPTRITKKGSGVLGAGGSCSERVWRLARRGTRHWVTATVYWSPLPFRAGTFSLYPPLSSPGGPGGRFRAFQAPEPEPSARPLAAGRRHALRVVYLHHCHHGRLFGGVNAAWAVWSRTCNSETSRRLASSSSAWAWTWACSVVTRTSRLASWPFRGWSFGCSSTSQRYPWGVGSRWAVSSPLPMRRLIVSVDTPKRRAASPTDTFSTTFLPAGMGNSIGVCLGNRLGAAWVEIGEFAPW